MNQNDFVTFHFYLLAFNSIILDFWFLTSICFPSSSWTSSGLQRPWCSSYTTFSFDQFHLVSPLISIHLINVLTSQFHILHRPLVWLWLLYFSNNSIPLLFDFLFEYFKDLLLSLRLHRLDSDPHPLVDLQTLILQTWCLRCQAQLLGSLLALPLCAKNVLESSNLLFVSSSRRTKAWVGLCLLDLVMGRFWQLEPSRRYRAWSSQCALEGKGSCGTSAKVKCC